jgi:hypothetical protein
MMANLSNRFRSLWATNRNLVLGAIAFDVACLVALVAVAVTVLL